MGEYLLTSPTAAQSGVDLSTALSALPKTQSTFSPSCHLLIPILTTYIRPTEGMDLSPLFTSPTSFLPSPGGELALFQAAGIPLYHGWLVDPDTPEAEVMGRAGDYDTAVNMIVEADHASEGRLLVGNDTSRGDFGSAAGGRAGPSGSGTSREEEESAKKIGDGTSILLFLLQRNVNWYGVVAMTIQRFLDATCTQLTYHGLFQLHALIAPGSLVALFRSSHLSVVWRPESTRVQAPVTPTEKHRADHAAPSQGSEVPPPGSNNPFVHHNNPFEQDTATTTAATSSAPPAQSQQTYLPPPGSPPPSSPEAGLSSLSITGPGPSSLFTSAAGPSNSAGAESHNPFVEPHSSTSQAQSSTSAPSFLVPVPASSSTQAPTSSSTHAHTSSSILPSSQTAPDVHTPLYALVTDHVFLHEPTVVWEVLQDVDGGAATFVDGELGKSVPMGGDWAGGQPQKGGYQEGGQGQTEEERTAMMIRMQGNEWVGVDERE